MLGKECWQETERWQGLPVSESDRSLCKPGLMALSYNIGVCAWRDGGSYSVLVSRRSPDLAPGILIF
jgi:hypothetical protein